MMTRIVFDVVKRRARKRFKCTCGQRFTRSRTFEGTVNPYNQNADGSVKSRSEVYADMVCAATVWETLAEECPKCGKEVMP